MIKVLIIDKYKNSVEVEVDSYTLHELIKDYYPNAKKNKTFKVLDKEVHKFCVGDKDEVKAA